MIHNNGAFPNCCIKSQQHTFSFRYNVLSLSKYLHISPVLYQRHWLPVQHRVHFKILILKFKAIHGLAPKYIIELRNIKPRSIFIIVDEIKVYGYTLVNGKCLSHQVTDLSVLLPHIYGIVCKLNYVIFNHQLFLNAS